MNAKATTTLPQRTMWFTMVYLEGGRRSQGEKEGEEQRREIRDGREEEVGKVGEGI